MWPRWRRWRHDVFLCCFISCRILHLCHRIVCLILYGIMKQEASWWLASQLPVTGCQFDYSAAHWDTSGVLSFFRRGFFIVLRCFFLFFFLCLRSTCTCRLKCWMAFEFCKICVEQILRYQCCVSPVDVVTFCLDELIFGLPFDVWLFFIADYVTCLSIFW